MEMFVIVIFALVVAGLAWSLHVAKERREAAQSLADKQGLRFSPAKDRGLASRYNFLDKLRQDSNRYALLILLPLVFVVATYNTLVALRNHISKAWSNIDTELKRRYKLIPNLVETVKGYARHERETLEQVIELRKRCIAGHGDVSHQARSEKQLVEAVRKLLAMAESYPDLKASKNYLELQKELVNTEDRIQAARRFYNGNVRDYRNKCETFPSNMVASLFNFKPHDFFDVEPVVREAPSLAGQSTP